MNSLFRYITNNKFYSILNITGLSIGIACCFFMVSYVLDELSYDRYHEKSDRIFRLTQEYHSVNFNQHFARLPYGYVLNLPDEYPEVMDIVRFQHSPQSAVRANSKIFREDRFFVTDANVFAVFDFRLIAGDVRTALSAPNSVVLSETTAKKYFPGQNPIGQRIFTLNQWDSEPREYTVTGVVEDTPKNSNFTFDILASFDNAPDGSVDEWNYIYLLLQDETAAAGLRNKLPQFTAKYRGEEFSEDTSLEMQALTDIHLRSDLDREIEQNGSMTGIYIFSSAALLVLLIAGINFTNLSTVIAARRSRDVGIRKVLGASRSQLIMSSYRESIVMGMLGLAGGIIIVLLAYPVYNSLSGKVFEFSILIEFNTLVTVAGIMLLISAAAGTYPALYLASFKPLSALSGYAGSSRGMTGKKSAIRKSLIVFQFAISVFLVLSMSVTYFQMEFLQNKDIGFNTERMLAIRNISIPVQEKYPVFKSSLLLEPGIFDVSAAMEEPSNKIMDAGQVTVGGFERNATSPFLYVLPVDDNIINFLDLELIAGNGFIPGGSDSSFTYVLNETAVKLIGWDTPEQAVGKRFIVGLSVPEEARPKEGAIVGVVKDFNYSGLYDRVKPIVMFRHSKFIWNILDKIRGGNEAESLASVERVWDSVYPEYPLEYDYVDDLFSSLYKSEENQKTLLQIFSSISLLVACLGLFGMAAFTTGLRKREIGIRKVLGDTTTGIITLISKEYIVLIVIANLIALPVSYFVMERWLEFFAYRISFEWWMFVLSGGIALLIGLLTVGIQSLKAASSNPVDVIRYE